MTTFARTIGFFRPSRFTGPILTKELRVSSRRKRNYALRTLYIGLMLLFAAVTWANTVGDVEGGMNAVGRMAEAGKAIIAAIAWFQFIMIQLVAVAICSTSISEEIYRRTLTTLLSTPITSFQVVMGKLLSKLWQLMLLVLMSLPLLALLRVMGGVTWQFVLASSMVTLTTGLLAGTVATFYSVLFRHAWSTMLVAMATLMGMFVVLWWMVALAMAATGGAGGEAIFKLMMHVNPYAAMGMLTMELFMPGMPGMAGLGGWSWIVNVVAMLVLTGLLLIPTVSLVRRRALKLAIGAVPPAQQGALSVARPTGPPPLPSALAVGAAAPAAAAAASAVPTAIPLSSSFQAPSATGASRPLRLRKITGCPVLWKELRQGLLKSTTARIVGLVVPLTLLAIIFACLGSLDGLKHGEVHVPFAIIYTLCAVIVAAVLPATTVSSEREAGSLQLLLTTTLTGPRIMLAKALGSIRRGLGVWAFMMVHLLIFSLFSVLDPAVLLHAVLLWAWVSIFLTGTGLLMSTVFRRTTSAVVCNLCLALVLWAVVPMAFEGKLAEGNPIAQAGEFVEKASTEPWIDWFAPEAKATSRAWEPFNKMMASLVIYGVLGVGAFAIACGQLRRRCI